MRVRLISALPALALAIAPLAALAEAQDPAELLATFERDARQVEASFKSFSSERGAHFFKDNYGGEWSCSSCHTSDPTQPGKHAKTGKTIAPLAPAANPVRLTSAAKVEKWFTRNCNDVLGRACTQQEKGDVLKRLAWHASSERRRSTTTLTSSRRWPDW